MTFITSRVSVGLMCALFLRWGSPEAAFAQDNTPLQLCNVIDYGAVGGDSDDDTVAIQNAVEAASISGRPVYFPPGVYIVSAAILPQSDTTIVGAGSKRSVLKASPSFPPGVAVISITQGRRGITIRDVGFTSVNATGSNATYRGVEILSAEDVALESCWFDQGFYWSVYIGEGSRNCGVNKSVSEGTQIGHNVEINDSSFCYVTNCRLKNSAGQGIELYRTLPGDLKGNRLTGNLVEASRLNGILCDGDLYSIVSNNTIRGAGINGVHIRPSERLGPTFESVAGHLVGNTIMDCGGTTDNGVTVVSGATGWTIHSNTVVNSGFSGIWIGGTANSVTGNTCRENRYHGIYVAAGAHTITGNTCINNSMAGPEAGDGIRLEGSLNTTVTSNRCSDTRTPKLQGWGVTLVLQSNNNPVTGNSLSGNRRGPILDLGSGNTKTGNN